MAKSKWLIGAIFTCADCAKEWQDYRTAQVKARRHAQKAGHQVTGEVTYAVQYPTRTETRDNG